MNASVTALHTARDPDSQNVAPELQPRQRRIVVAGFGNALRGDDGAGWHVARILAARWEQDSASSGAAVCVLAGHQPLPEWVPSIAAADVAYFVDAEAGTNQVRVRTLTAPGHAAPLAAAGLMDGHALGVEGLLAMAQTLYGHAPVAYLITLPVVGLSFTERLSPPVTAAVDQVVAALDRALREDGAATAALAALHERASKSEQHEEAVTCA